MAGDDEYVEGDSGSEAAETPVEDTARPAVGETIDSAASAEAPVHKIHAHRNAARTQEARKAFAAAVLAAKEKPAVTEEDDPEDVALAEPEAPPKAEAPKPAEVKAEAPKPAASPPVTAPPAPSLDPEVRKLKEQLAAERKQLEAERAELAKQTAVPPPPDALSLEEYIDSPPRAYRNWLENMRGEKFANDDEFKAEVKDFITSMSTDVLGVPLPENVRAQFDAAQARKIVRTNKTIQARKQAEYEKRIAAEREAAAAKEQEAAVEREWQAAVGALNNQFKVAETSSAYPWLAAEDEPGKIVVDVIRAALSKDGTQLSWVEASKKANDYLEMQNMQHYEKRSALLQAKKAAPPTAKPAVATPPPPAPPPPAPKKPEKWSNDKHRANTLAAFRQGLQVKP